MSETRLEHRVPNAAEHRRIAEAVGWARAFDWPTVPRSLERSLFGVVAMAGGEAIGMGRLVGDGTMYFYIQDVAVLPSWQGRGIGREIVEALLVHVREVAPATAFVGLFATAEAVPLYERMGFGREGLTGMTRVVDPAG